jgi:hypothetical protein
LAVVTGPAIDVPSGLPAPLLEMSNVATARASTPFAVAFVLEAYLKANYKVDNTIATGQSYGHLLRSLTQGTTAPSDQFATAFATLGRAQGLPTRVVVGFGPGIETSAGVYEVRAGDALVWPEVHFEQIGWVPFDPTPASGANDGTVPGGIGGGQDVVVVEQELPEPVQPGDAAPTRPGSEPRRDSSVPVGTLIAVVLGALVLVAIGAAALVALVKRRRTASRRHAADPRQQVIGAWHDVLERLREQHGNQQASATVEELVVASQLSSSALAGLYRPVTRSLYSDNPIEPADAESAWRARDRFVHDTRRHATSARRLGYAIDPRPLRRSPARETKAAK